MCVEFPPFPTRWLSYFFLRPNGIRFMATAGTTEFLKRWQPQEGDIVSFKHHGYLLASKKPKYPTIYRMRHELKWEDVVQNWKEQKQVPTGNLPYNHTNVTDSQRPHPQNINNNSVACPVAIVDKSTQRPLEHSGELEKIFLGVRRASRLRRQHSCQLGRSDHRPNIHR